jgi:hypothetical protein
MYIPTIDASRNAGAFAKRMCKNDAQGCYCMNPQNDFIKFIDY